MGRAARWGTLLATIVSLALAPAAALALDIAPPSATVEAGNQVSATLTSLPLDSSGGPTCLEASGTSPIYLTAQFVPVCGGQAGWSSTMTIRTIPATPSGSHTLVIELCPQPGCQITAGNENKQPVDSRSWVVQVTPAPVPVETVTIVPATPAPTATRPSASPSPSVSPPRSAPAATPTSGARTSSPAPPQGTATPASITPATTGPSSGSPSPLAAGQAAGLVLDHPTVAPGESLGVTAIGCNPNAPALVSVAGAVTTTASAGADGKLHTVLTLPSSLRSGRYQVVASCGANLSAAVDVAHRSLAPFLIALGVVVALAAGVGIGRLTRRTGA